MTTDPDDMAAAQPGTAVSAGRFSATPAGVEWRRDGFLVATDPALIDFSLTAEVLAGTYWATGIPEDVVRQSVEGSLAFGMYEVTAGGAGTGNDVSTAGGAGTGDGVSTGDGTDTGDDVSTGDNEARAMTQIGFARVITDRAVFAWVGDVFVVDSHQGRGLGLWLMRCVMAHPELQGMRRWMLASTTARGLYAKLGFTQLAKPELFMEIYDPEIHSRQR